MTPPVMRAFRIRSLCSLLLPLVAKTSGSSYRSYVSSLPLTLAWIACCGFSVSFATEEPVGEDPVVVEKSIGNQQSIGHQQSSRNQQSLVEQSTSMDQQEVIAQVAELAPFESSSLGRLPDYLVLKMAAESKAAAIAATNGWVLICSALVLFMAAPGLALFYAGMVRKKNVLSVFIQSLFLTAVMSVIWAIYGYSFAFSGGGDLNPWIGGMDHCFLGGVSRTWDDFHRSPYTPMWSSSGAETSVTKLSHMIFQGMFFSIAPVIMCGALAERVKFHGMIAFSILWGTFVYCPIAHWIWGGGILSYPLGLMGGSLDFAGGSVVHISAGISSLVAAMVLGPRLGFGKDPMPPHNLTYTATGAAMLWFGWFGFNAGNAGTADAVAANAFATTHFAGAAGAIGWWLLEWRARGKPTVLGVSSGLVAGLVCITPGAGFVQPMAAILFGFSAGIACYCACSLCKRWVGYDDSLDAFGIHGVAGILGTILTGLFASRACNNAGNGSTLGLLEGGTLLPGQLASLVVVLIYSALTSLVLLKVVDWTIGLRVSASDEREGLDVQQHGEEGYIFL
jgi:ammonium transporter, Amt family